DLPIADQIGREDAGRITGVHAGVFDVLHHATDHAPPSRPVGEGIDVRLERIFQEAVDQDRVFRGDARGFDEIVAERPVVVDDFHRPAAEHVGWPPQNRIAKWLLYADR